MDPTDELNDSLFLFHSLSPAQKTMLAGGIAGSVAKSVTAPLSRMTILYQVGNVLSSFSSTAQSGSSGSSGSGSGSGSVIMRQEFTGSLLESSRRVIREEGFKAFWKGNMTSVLHRFPYSAINFSTYEICRSYLCNRNSNNCNNNNRNNNYNNNNTHSNKKSNSNSNSNNETPLTRFIAGAVSGAVACSACYPLDIIRTRLTVDTSSPSSASSSSVLDQLSQIIRNEGFLGLYRGLAVSLAVSVPNLAIGFSSYGTIKDIMQNIESPVFRQNNSSSNISSSNSKSSSSSSNSSSNSKNSKNSSNSGGDGNKLNSFGCLVAGASSGIISSVLIFPADIVRRRMQVIGLLPPSATTSSTGAGASSSHTILGQVRQIYSGAGLRGFYRGLVPELLKVTPMVGVTFFMYETTLGLLGHS